MYNFTFKNENYFADQLYFFLRYPFMVPFFNQYLLFKNGSMLDFGGTYIAHQSYYTPCTSWCVPVAFDSQTWIANVTINIKTFDDAIGISSLKICTNKNCGSDSWSIFYIQQIIYNYRKSANIYLDFVGFYGSINQCGKNISMMSYFGVIYNGS